MQHSVWEKPFSSLFHVAEFWVFCRPAAGVASQPYEISEYRLPNKNATKLLKVQTDKRIQRRDSVAVSAGMPREQLALEDRLNAIVGQGNQALRGGKASDAIKQYESALELLQKQPLLAEHHGQGRKLFLKRIQSTRGPSAGW